MRRTIRTALIGGTMVAAVIGSAVLALGPSTPLAAHDPDEEARITAWLEDYVAAINASDLEALGTYYHERVTVYEGGNIDDGWTAYRDHHLGPELKAFENLRFTFTDVAPHVPEKGARLAWVTASYGLKATIDGRDIDAGGLQTLILVKGEDGSWKIRHAHSSSRRSPAG